MVEAPARFGRYEIVRRLSKGMTDVYLAFDTVENRNAVLKLIPDGDGVSQLVLEAERRGVSLQKELRVLDPRVIDVYDFGEAEGYFFIAMQYVEGRNLAEVLAAENAIDPNRAATIALEICEQLAKFHSWQSTVVHGDIKPSNIHLGPHDTVRLLDFGIAKALRDGRVTTAHNFGSPGYCSPERLERSEVDPQSDLWAVGATLYEMLAGVPPYQADDTRKLEGLIRAGRPPRALPSSCPRPLRSIVAKALAHKPEARYQSASEFQADLQAFLEHRPPQAEIERRAAWSPGATIEAAREVLRKATRTMRRARLRLKAVGAVAWFAMGMALSMSVIAAWQIFEGTRTSPASSVAPDLMLPALYVATADRVLEAYQTSDHPSLDDFDWQKAEVCLERAVALGRDDSATRGKLALSGGYAILQRLASGEYSEAAAARMRAKARDLFAGAAMRLPADPAPHLALARLYVYTSPDVDQGPDVEQALMEFSEAEQRRFKLGPREIEQEGDAFRLRALEEAGALEWDDAAKDVQSARRQYQLIPGFDQVDSHLRELDRIHRPTPKKVRRQLRWR